MIPEAISRIIILVIGVLYPAYESHKAIRTRNIQNYMRWILYWIAYSLFICAEMFTDIFVAWLPFYYELKIVFVIWLVLPFTNGGIVLFRYVIRPQFSKWEQVTDRLLAALHTESLTYILVFWTRSLQWIVNFVIEQTLLTHSKLVNFFQTIHSDHSTTKPEKKATGRRMRKVVAEGQQLLTESEQLHGDLNVRTTRAKTYVNFLSKDST